MKRPEASGAGIALLITLSMIVMITIVIVGFAVSMRGDRPAAKSHLEKTRARLLAQRAADEVVAALQRSTGDPNRNWISQPGQLVVGADAAGSGGRDERKVLQTVVPLSSGSPGPSPTPVVFESPNLNLATIRDPSSGLITNLRATPSDTSPIPLRLRWIYLREDGTKDLSETPAFLPGNRIVGRYAFWTDDESSKVNYNLAWGRSAANTNPTGHPSRVELTALAGMTGAMANATHGLITSTPDYTTMNEGFFNTPDDGRRVELQPGGNGTSDVLQTNKFDITHYSSDPDTTFFNEGRIVLTTRPDRAGWTYNGSAWVGRNGLSGDAGRPRYIRILTDAAEGTKEQPLVLPITANDPGRDLKLDTNKLNETMAALLSYLQRTDWPMVSGTGSFQSKYYPVPLYPTDAISRERLAQLAINIIDYVRSVESPSPIPDVLRLYRTAIGSPFQRGTASAQNNLSYMGIVRGPRITEMGLFVDPPVGGQHVTAKFKVELYLPPNYGLSSIDVSTLFLTTESAGVPSQALTPILDGKILASEVTPSPILSAGGYVTVTRVRQISGTPAVRPTSILMRAAVSNNLGDRRFDVVPLIGNVSERAPYTVDSAAVSEADMRSIEVDDPRVNKQRGDWKQNTRNTFGTVNSVSTLGQLPASVLPQQDTDANGLLTASSMFFPPPAGQVYGTIDNTRGMVLSAGELGRIPTGIESTVILDGQAIPPGIPWRTLRLQPNNQSTSVVPDWALIDCFAAPLVVDKNADYIYVPRKTAIGGRVNVNARAEPFGIQRLQPLAAVFQGASRSTANPANVVSASEAATLAARVMDRTLTTGGKSYGYANAYDSTGEIVEIAGIADAGEDSEALYREVVNLITTRGNVYSIFAVGQALEQAPDGRISVTAEQRSRTIVERFLNPATNSAEFGGVFFRTLTP